MISKDPVIARTTISPVSTHENCWAKTFVRPVESSPASVQTPPVRTKLITAAHSTTKPACAATGQWTKLLRHHGSARRRSISANAERDVAADPATCGAQHPRACCYFRAKASWDRDGARERLDPKPSNQER